MCSSQSLIRAKRFFAELSNGIHKLHCNGRELLLNDIGGSPVDLPRGCLLVVSEF